MRFPGRKTAPIADAQVGPAPLSGFAAACGLPCPDGPGQTPLSTSAIGLFALMGCLQAPSHPPDPERLYRAALAEIRAFEGLALQAGADSEQVKLARYALCATLDDLAQSAGWSEGSGWESDLMVGSFHRENIGGRHFFDLLDQLGGDPRRNSDLLEVFHHCLAAGFQGELRGTADGAARRRAILTRLADLIRASRSERSPQALRPPDPVRTQRRVSVPARIFLLTALMACLWSAGQMLLARRLFTQSEAVFAAFAAAPEGRPVTSGRPTRPFVPELPPRIGDERRRLEIKLAPEISGGMIRLIGEGSRVVLRLDPQQFFTPASDRLRPEARPVLARIASALDGFEGQIFVSAHAEDQRILSARFPAQMPLGLARAERLRRGLFSDHPRVGAEAHHRAAGGDQSIDLLLIRER